MWSLILENDTNELIYKIEIDLMILKKKTKHFYQRETRGKRANQELGMNIHTLYIIYTTMYNV